MAEPFHLRASDADRDAIAERLRRAAVEGRLEPQELEERLHEALRARTYGDLERLVADLPPQPVVRARRRNRSLAAPAGVATVALTLAAVAAVLAVAAVMTAWWILWAIVWIALRGRGCARWCVDTRMQRRRFVAHR